MLGICNGVKRNNQWRLSLGSQSTERCSELRVYMAGLYFKRRDYRVKRDTEVIACEFFETASTSI